MCPTCGQVENDICKTEFTTVVKQNLILLCDRLVCGGLNEKFLLIPHSKSAAGLSPCKPTSEYQLLSHCLMKVDCEDLLFTNLRRFHVHLWQPMAMRSLTTKNIAKSIVFTSLRYCARREQAGNNLKLL